MRVMLVYSGGSRLEDLARGIAAGLEAGGHYTDVVQAEQRSSTPLPVAQYDLVCVGSPVFGFFGGQVAGDIDQTLKRMRRLEGRKAAAFVTPKLFGTSKALRALMGMLEHQGAWVEDFAAVRSRAEAEAFGRRLQKLA